MRPASTRRGSTSIEHSQSASGSKCARSASISACISSRERNVGVPPPQCNWQILRSSPSNAAVIAISRDRAVIYFADRP